MKASLSWLKEYVDITMRPEELAELLTMSGLHVESLEITGDDVVIEFEITSNRSDCLSIIGIAREIAAVTDKRLRLPGELAILFRVKGQTRSHGKKAVSAKIQIDEKKLCPHYSGRIITDVSVKESPEWIEKAIKSVGLRPVNNIVDITNFLLFETGQPMHAFDLDKLEGSVVIRQAEKGENIKTIDGVMRILEKGMLVIADNRGPIAVAGVMGGVDTEVTKNTNNILLESAWFDPISVRRTARVLGISTESSYRFERSVDNSMVIPASLRAANIIIKTAGGAIGSLIDVGRKTVTVRTIKFDPNETAKVLGLDIPEARQKKMLEVLRFSVSEKKYGWDVTIPTSRRDISQSVDIIEEIARVNGYNKVPETIPRIIGNIAFIDKKGRVKEKVRTVLSGMGLNEIITYNLISSAMLSNFEANKETHLCVQNPLSQEQEVLTQTLLAGMMKAISWNINRKNNNISFYEIGNVYRKTKKSGFSEELHLSLGCTGLTSNDWISGNRKTTFYDLKGILIGLLEELGLENIKIVPDNNTAVYLDDAAIIKYGNIVIGNIGSINKRVLSYFDIRDQVFGSEINLDAIIEKSVLERKFKPLPRYPSIVHDISMVVNAGVSGEGIIECINDSGAQFIKDIKLMGIYKGEHIPKGKTGLLYRIEYQCESKTLTDNEIEKDHNKIRQDLATKLGIIFR